MSLGANPTIKLGETKIFFKPYASVSRTLGPDVAGDLKALKADLRIELFRALQAEVDFVNSVYAELDGANDIEQLKLACKKVLDNAEVTYETVAEGAGKTQGKTKPKVRIKKGKS